MNGLGLFSGGCGGIEEALEPWVEWQAYVEIDERARANLISLMEKGWIQSAPIWDDIRTLRGGALPNIDIIAGGFPCQDISVANPNGKGLGGKRSGLFYEAVRLTAECRPRFVFLENVPAVKEFVPTIRAEFEALGYACRDGFLSAEECGAKCESERWWFLAKAAGERRVQFPDESGGRTEALPRTQPEKAETAGHDDKSNRRNWETAANRAYGNAFGISDGVDRFRIVGNAVPRITAREAFKRLMGLEH